MQKMDACIGSGGINIWERFYLGIPSIVFQLSKNQRENIKFLKRKKCISVLKNANSRSVNHKINLLIKKFNLYKNKIKSNLSFLDKHGSDRIYLKTMGENFIKNKLNLRIMKSNDVYFLHKLANDPINRKYAKNKIKIEFYDHKEWFSRKLKSKLSKIFILECLNTPLGQIRLDIRNNQVYIDYAIDKCFRKIKLGQKILSLILEKKNFKKFLKKKKLIAYVHKSNLASKKIFHNLSFQQFVSKGNFVKFIRTYEN